MSQPTQSPPTLREQLASGDRLLATFNVIASADVVELIALAGFDAVIIDLEHGPHDLGCVRHSVVAAGSLGLRTIVRVRALDPSLIGTVLDLGTDGVLVPHVDSARDAEAAVSAARFAPEGGRGANPWVSAARFGYLDGWFAQANAEVVTMIMIESTAALRHLPEILAVPGLDAVFFGPMDLSHSLGVPGETNHPMVVSALTNAVRDARAHGVSTCVFVPDPATASAWWERGVRFVACGVDSGLIRTALTAAAGTARRCLSR
jgi:4-hydroxy-2-oxoheptanedioate aldolase